MTNLERARERAKARSLEKNYAGCTVVIECNNVKDYCLNGVEPTFGLSDWTDGAMIEIWVDGACRA